MTYSYQVDVKSARVWWCHHVLQRERRRKPRPAVKDTRSGDGMVDASIFLNSDAEEVEVRLV